MIDDNYFRILGSMTSSGPCSPLTMPAMATASSCAPRPEQEGSHRKETALQERFVQPPEPRDTRPSETTRGLRHATDRFAVWTMVSRESDIQEHHEGHRVEVELGKASRFPATLCLMKTVTQSQRDASLRIVTQGREWGLWPRTLVCLSLSFTPLKRSVSSETATDQILSKSTERSKNSESVQKVNLGDHPVQEYPSAAQRYRYRREARRERRRHQPGRRETRVIKGALPTYKIDAHSRRPWLSNTSRI
jgi:hypothetical protein